MINMLPTSVDENGTLTAKSVEERASRRNAQQQHMLLIDDGQNHAVDPQPYVPILFYSEPLYHSIWDAFKMPNAELQELLNSSILDQQYQEIHDDIDNSIKTLQKQAKTISFEQFFSQSQLAIKKIRQGVKIQYKQRLCLMTTELAQMKQ
jgi:hypothetical protein